MGLLAKLFGRRDKRCIFEFDAGDGVRRRVDPLKTFLALKADKELIPDRHDQELDSEIDVVCREAHRIVIAATRRVFELPEFQPRQPTDSWRTKTTGVTDGEAIAVFRAFGNFISGLKKNGNSPPISAPPTQESSIVLQAPPPGNASVPSISCSTEPRPESQPAT